MSKKHGHRKKRRSRQRKARPNSPSLLLRSVADSLNACADAGLDPRVVQGAVMTRAGYVLFLPVKGDRKRERWSARVLALDPLSPGDDGPDD